MAMKHVLEGSRSLLTLFDSGTLGAQSDRELLECFQSDPGSTGQEAFRILVERHGPMVLGLCRSLVRDQHEAEDAFQATFLVLVRKAASIERRDTLGPWLFGVASRVARRARTRLIRRQKREFPVIADIPARDQVSFDGFSTEQLLHEEIARLPDSFRRPLILCCLQGLSYDLAAQRLGLKEPTLRGRLERARKRLATRLRARGVPAVLAGPAIEAVRGTMSTLPATLIESTVQFSMRWSSLTGLLGERSVVPDSISALAQGVIQSMRLQSIRISAVAVLAAGAIGTAVLAQPGRGRVADGGAPAAITADGVQAEGANGEQTEPQEDRAPAVSRAQRSKEADLDRPDGKITNVDYETKEVLVNITRRMGARPQMKMTVLDALSPDIPAGKPKGSIELTSVGDTYSHAHIIKTNSSIDPMRVGDIVYSPMWTPSRPTRFALVGKMDINRDSKDDREELKRMIQEAGGVVDFDFPPPDVGKETGALSPRIDWYVIDDRPPVRGPQAKRDKREGEVINEARLNGIRPMTIGKLLAYLGHEMNSPSGPEQAKQNRGEHTPSNAAQDKGAPARTAKPDSAATFVDPSKGPAQRFEEKNAQIRHKLAMVIDVDFAEGATLETLLKHIKKVTTDATFTGIPIYVDPNGLSEVKKTMWTEVAQNFKQRSIRSVLNDSLGPNGLSYDIRDGFLLISSRTAILEKRVEDIDRKLDRVLEMLGRLAPAK